MLSHANLWLGAISVAHYLGLAAADRTLAVLPLAFDYGQNQLLSTWAAGGHAIAFDYLLPRDVVRAFDEIGDRDDVADALAAVGAKEALHHAASPALERRSFVLFEARSSREGAAWVALEE